MPCTAPLLALTDCGLSIQLQEDLVTGIKNFIRDNPGLRTISDA